MRRLNTNNTQILHRIRLKKFVPNAPLEDKYKEEKLQPDETIIIPQDDLYTISWEADFEYELFEQRKDDWPHTATRLPNDAASGGVDYYVIENESSSTNNHECSSDKNENDVTEKGIWPRPAISRDSSSPLSETLCGTKNDENDVNENTIRPRPATSRDVSSPLNETPTGTENENDVTNDLESTEIARNGGADISGPGISENEKNEGNSSPRERKYNLRPNRTANFTDEYRYKPDMLINVQIRPAD